jgi:hypothetical protein
MAPRVARTTALALTALAASALLAACDEPRVSRGRVEGVVRAVPTCPALQQGQLCLPRAVDGEVQAVRDGAVVAAARTSAAGAYELAVDAGDYTLVVDTGGQTVPQCPPIAIQVEVAATATVDIDCIAGG